MKLQPSTKIFLKIKNKKYRIPVNPSEFTLDQRTSDKSENVAGVGGIIIPDSAKEKPMQGKVIAVGKKLDKDGKEIKFDVKKGDTVLLPKYGGTEVKLGDKKLQLVREEDLLGVIEK